MADENKAAFGQYTTGRKYQGAKKRAEKPSDVNLIKDPKTYAAVMGLLGTRPDEMGFSVLHPDYEAIRRVADPAFAIGTALGVAPLMSMARFSRPVQQAVAASQRGAVRVPIAAIAPQEEALRLAQQRAALPIEQGGLGLPKDNTPMDRAKALGYTDRKYMGGHQAPMSADDVGAPLHTLDKVYPSDIYSNNGARYYGDGAEPARDASLVRRLQALRNQPDAQVSIYRAVPKDAGKYINHGDWVTMDRQYAKDHGESVLNGNYKIIHTRTPAKTLFSDGNSIYELGVDKTQRFADGPASMQTMISAKAPFERSRFAAFDPFRKDVATAIAMGVAAPDLLARTIEDEERRRQLLSDEEESLKILERKKEGGKVKFSDSLDAMRIEMAEGGKAAFGVFPQMKPRRSKQDREAAKNVPVDLARGVISGALGIPGDIESLARLPYQLITGNESPTILPTSEDIEKRLPFKSDTPVGGVATGLGQIAGGFATPAPAIRAAKKLRQTIGNLPPSNPRMSQMGVIKAPGGNWLTGSVEKAIEPLKMRGLTQAQADEMAARPTPIMMAREGVLSKSDEALNQWIDRNLTNYVKKQMATPDDPVRKLAEQGIDPQGRFQYAADKNLPTLEIIREELGFPPKGMGQSPQAQNWEKIADETTLFETAGDIIAIAQNNKLYGDTFQKYKKILEENPWLLKVDPNTPVYSPKAGNWSYGDTGFDHIVDVLRQDLREGRIRPEQLNKVSMEQAVRRTYEYDQEMAKKMREAQIKATEGMPIYKEYPEGYKWVELALPKLDVLPEGSSFQKLPSGMTQVVDSSGSPLTVPASDEAHALRLLGKERGQKTLENALKYEGETMGHCVGGYCPDVMEGRSRIFSLRDAKGEPHVTVEVEPAPRIGFREGEGPKTPEERFDLQTEWLQGVESGKIGGDVTFANWWRQKNNIPEPELPFQISQIKGKQNRAPKEEYLPFVQDFVRGGQWAKVNDFGNTGLVRKSDLIDKFTPEQLDAVGVGEYLTKGEYDDLLLKALQPPAGMKKGGKVRFTDNPDAMRLELQMAAGGLARAAKALKAAKEAPMKASEALGRVEGRPLVITQADRTKVGGGFLGGPGFSGLQLEDPAYRAAEAAWGVKTPGVAKMILGGGKAAGKDPVYAAMLGTPTQHQSNQMVFDKLYGDFKKSAKKGNLNPELRDLINTRLASAVDKKGNPVFPPDVDILGKNFKDLANTFDRRAVTANLIGGVTVGGKKGQIIDYDKIIRETTDPLLIEAPTGALGNRLFTLSGGIIDRPDLHPAFPTILQGEDLGVSFNPVTRDLIMKDFIEQTMREKGRAPGYMDYTRGYPPSQLITEDLLTELQKLGLKEGGEVTSPAAQIDGNDFLLAARRHGLSEDIETLNKMVRLVNQGATVDEAARIVSGNAVHKAAGGEISADDLIIEERPL